MKLMKIVLGQPKMNCTSSSLLLNGDIPKLSSNHRSAGAYHNCSKPLTLDLLIQSSPHAVCPSPFRWWILGLYVEKDEHRCR